MISFSLSLTVLLKIGHPLKKHRPRQNGLGNLFLISGDTHLVSEALKDGLNSGGVGAISSNLFSKLLYVLGLPWTPDCGLVDIRVNVVQNRLVAWSDWALPPDRVVGLRAEVGGHRKGWSGVQRGCL